MPSECGNLISRSRVIAVPPSLFPGLSGVPGLSGRRPCPTVSVAHSPTPSAVRRSEERRVGKEWRERWWGCQAEDGIRDDLVTGVQTCALPISEIGRERRIEHAE